METKNITPETKAAATAIDETKIPPVNRPVKDKTITPPPVDPPGKFHTFLHGRAIWFIGAILLILAGIFGYNWAFGKPKV